MNGFASAWNKTERAFGLGTVFFRFLLSAARSRPPRCSLCFNYITFLLLAYQTPPRRASVYSSRHRLTQLPTKLLSAAPEAA
jgi:hypothetical protein